MRGTPAKIGGGGEGELPSFPVVAATRCLGKTQSLENYMLWCLRLLRSVWQQLLRLLGPLQLPGELL